MKAIMQRKIGAAAALLAAALAIGSAPAAQPSAGYTPMVGQEGKDVIWVPTPQALVERMLAAAEVTPDDFVVDLGSGDGRTVITAAKKFGARALGLEYNPRMVDLSRRNAEKEGVADRAQFRHADIFATDFSDATVVTMYLLPTLNLKLRPTLLAMRPGTRIVSHAFAMDDWMPDLVESADGRKAYLWIVPAQVAGHWRIRVSGASAAQYLVELTQKYQMLEGSARSGSATWRVRDGKVRGDEITFTVGDGAGARAYSGKVAGDRMAGTTARGEGRWSAERVK